MMDFYPPEFAAVPYGSIEASACAPQVEDLRFRGILIRSPERIAVGPGETAMVPICGFYQLPSLPLMRGAVMVVHLRGSVVPPQDGQVVIDEGENAPDVPDPAAGQPLDPRLWAHKVSTAFFHLDGQRYLRQPLPPGRYELFVSYGEARSNVVRFEITRT